MESKNSQVTFVSVNLFGPPYTLNFALCSRSTQLSGPYAKSTHTNKEQRSPHSSYEWRLPLKQHLTTQFLDIKSTTGGAM